MKNHKQKALPFNVALRQEDQLKLEKMAKAQGLTQGEFLEAIIGVMSGLNTDDTSRLIGHHVRLRTKTWKGSTERAKWLNLGK